MRIAIFGATGMLGKALLQQWHGDDIAGFGSKDIDIRDLNQVAAAVQKTRPEWIVLAAAYTDVDGCEINPTLAFSVNRHGAVNVAKTAADTGSKLLFISSDYVFDGKKTSAYETRDTRNPINVYGRAKAEAEEKISEVLPRACIVRTSWLFGPGGKCFPDTILKAAETRSELKVVNDQRGSPTYTRDLADAIIALCRRNAAGIVHCTNSGDCTWFDFACEILRQAGKDTRVRPTTSNEFVRAAERPSYSVLSPASLNAYGIHMRPWQDTLPEYLSLRQS
jgi:dTDP-4-dehydrorhamnose reductase